MLETFTRAQCITNSCSLEGLDGLDVRIHIISNGLEVLEDLFSLVNDGLVLQDGAVVIEVDGAGEAGVGTLETLSLAMTFTESLESRNGLCRQKGFKTRVQKALGGYHQPFPSPREL
jgi:hypothetical protein